MLKANFRIRSLVAISSVIVILTGCHNNQTGTAPIKTSTVSPQNSNHERAIQFAAQGDGYLLKQPERGIEYYKQALQLEPDNRTWKSSLAFAYYKAKRQSDAVPLWQELAKGNDSIASQAKHLLNKAGVNQ